MKNALMILICTAVLSTGCFSINVSEEQAKMLQISSLQDDLPPEAERYLQGIDPENADDFFEQAWSVIENAFSDQRGVWKSAVRSALRILFVIVICGIFSIISGEQGVKSIKIAGSLALSGLCLADISAMIGLGKETLQSVSDYSLALIPVLTAAAAASGNVTASAAAASGSVLFLRILIWAFQYVMAPVIYAIIAFSLAEGISDQAMFGRLVKMLSGALKNGLKILMFVFSGWLSISGIISGNVDAMALKAAKLTSSTFVPVVGGMVADAAETVLVSASLLKNSVGIFGMLAVLSIIVVPFLKIGIHYIILQATEFLGATVGMKAHTDFVHSVCTGMGNLMGIITCCSLMLFLSCVCVMKVTVLK